MRALVDLMGEARFEDLSVGDISERADIKRSGFYFYFDSKYAVLAQCLAEVAVPFEESTQQIVPRGAGESPAEFAEHLIRLGAEVFARYDPVVSASYRVRSSEPRIQEFLSTQLDGVVARLTGIITDEIDAGTAHPINDDTAVLVRMLTVTSAMTFARDVMFLGKNGDLEGTIPALKALWVNALWGGADALPDKTPSG